MRTVSGSRLSVDHIVRVGDSASESISGGDISKWDVVLVTVVETVSAIDVFAAGSTCG